MADYIERTEEIMLAMNAGARAIENTERYHGAVYTKDVLSDNPQKIPYLLAAKVLREVSDTYGVVNFKKPFSAEKQLCLSCAVRVCNFVENYAKTDGGDDCA